MRWAARRLFFKCETFQKCGAFKARGATNAVFALSEAEARRGVATHSSGNHAAALARAARLRGIPAYIVMPDNTPQAKRAAVRRYGGQITYCAATLAAREARRARTGRATGAAFVHPYDNLMVMAGQATVAAEFLGQVPQLDVDRVPGRRRRPARVAPRSRPRHCKPASACSAPSRPAPTMPRARCTAGNCSPAVRRRPSPTACAARSRRAPSARNPGATSMDILTVAEGAIISGMRELWEVLKIIVEPSGAVPTRRCAGHAAACKGSASASCSAAATSTSTRCPGWQRALDALEHQRNPLADADAHRAQRVAAARRAASCQVAVVARRAPDIPSGWPSAMAPPFGFTCAASSGRPSWRSTASACAAKASLSSMTSI